MSAPPGREAGLSGFGAGRVALEPGGGAGHIRLHVAQMRKCWEDRAFQYGMVFLMPREAVLARPQVRILQRGWAQEQEEIWNLVADLGRDFHVNGSYICRALVAYGVVEMNRKTQVIKPCLLTSETAELAAA